MPSRSILVLTAVVTVWSCEPATQISGRAEIIDGDSLEIRAASIRLFGIDAPEARQTCTRDGLGWPCGAQATQTLRALTSTGTITCTQKDIDSYGRIVAVCTAGGRDLGAELVRAGLALAYREYSGDYTREESAARAARRGMWAGEFIPPWDWRRDPRQEPTPDPSNAAECPIKGNINRTGERIYHVPGSGSYEQTVIDEARGERWFCSEDEARSAGWRAPRG